MMSLRHTPLALAIALAGAVSLPAHAQQGLKHSKQVSSAPPGELQSPAPVCVCARTHVFVILLNFRRQFLFFFS